MKRLAIGAAAALVALACAHAGPVYFAPGHPASLVSTGLDQTGLSPIGVRLTEGGGVADMD